MPTMQEIEDLEILFTMFKGEPGTRKSTQALSYPKPQYWASFDQKMDALILPMKYWGIKAADIHFDDFTSYNPFRDKLTQFQLACPFKTLIVDSVTTVADATNRQTIKAKAGTTTATGQEKGNRVGGISVNTMEDYKAEASAFQEMTALLKDIHKFHKVNIILIAHVIGGRDIKDAGSTHFARIICTGGKIISAKIPAVCGETYHFNIERGMSESDEGTYGLKTTHTGLDFARTALPIKSSIEFGTDPLYDKFILPGIKARKELGTTQTL
jgi:AAA domain